MLKIRFKNNKYNAVWLVEPRVTVGSSRQNDLVINDEQVAASQLEILVDHERLTLRNLSPLNIVRVNNDPVSDSCSLKAQDVILVGATELHIVDPKREPREYAPENMTVDRSKIPPATGWALKAQHPALASRVFPLREKNLLGRSSECDITLAAAHLSRRHASLEVIDGFLYVTDLDSSNGTWLNGKRVERERVKRGDELRFDTLVFGVIGPSDEFARTSVRPAINPAYVGRDDRDPRRNPVLTNAGDRSSSSAEPQHRGNYSMAILVLLALIIMFALYFK